MKRPSELQSWKPGGRPPRRVSRWAFLRSSAGASHMFMTPSTGACQASRRPSGDSFGRTLVGFPRSFRRGINGERRVWKSTLEGKASPSVLERSTSPPNSFDRQAVMSRVRSPDGSLEHWVVVQFPQIDDDTAGLWVQAKDDALIPLSIGRN